MGKIIKNKKLVLIAILLVASFLRLWKLSEVPVSLFGDELDVGYHAYSILKTGKDYSGNSWPLHFQSLAEWRTPLYLYSCVPTVALFGISPLGVRLPAAIFGTLGVWGIYLLVKKLASCGLRVAGFRKNLAFSIEHLALIASFLLALSPWHIQYSRAAFEVTQLLAFLIFGLYFFFKSVNYSCHPERVKRVEGSRRDSIAKRQAPLIASLQNDSMGKYLWLSVLLLTSTPWIYSTAKLFTPLLLVFLIITWRIELFGLPKKYLTKAVVVGLIVGLPIVYSTLFGGGSQRFSYISVFTDPTRETEIGF
ncbi:glycosyltransferase family 39 protein, partial [Patescibacteria group bacterium]|nr:glycosyltransferase family 39 protein [Patescibacteria group bacterium]